MTTKQEAQTSSTAKSEISLLRLSQMRPKVIAIAASTGGPDAINLIMRTLRGKTPCIPIAITQHIGKEFIEDYATQIASASGLTTKLADDGVLAKPGHIYIAGAGKHMEFYRNNFALTIRLNDGPPEAYCKPSANPMFRSLSDLYGPDLMCFVLTGMGEDGLEGARRVRENKGYVIAQSEETCSVWGMPRAVTRAGVAQAVLSITEIGELIKQVACYE